MLQLGPKSSRYIPKPKCRPQMLQKSHAGPKCYRQVPKYQTVQNAIDRPQVPDASTKGFREAIKA